MHWPNARPFSVAFPLLALLFAESGAAYAKETLRMRVLPVKTTLLVGEPLVLSMTFRGASELHWNELSKANSHLRVLVDRGRGFVHYLPKAFTPPPFLEPGKTNVRDKRADYEVTLAYDANLGDWVFSGPGTYRLVVEYQDETFGVVRSNAVSLTVTAPTGDEKTVHDTLRRIGPLFLGLHQPNKLPTELEPLVERFPDSVYLQEVRLMDLEHRIHQMAEAFDPDNPTGPRPDTKEERRKVAKRLMADLVPIGQSLADIEGQFQPEALRLLARLQAVSGDLDGERQTLQRIVRDFPNRAAGNAARAQLTDNEEGDDPAVKPRPKQ